MTHNYKYTENAFLPKSVIIPLVQEKDSICKPVVKPGEVVEEGQIIASSDFSVIHSPVPGTVTDICPVNSPNGKIEKAIKIITQGSFSYLGKKLAAEQWTSLSPASIERKLEGKGVINTLSCTKPVSITEQIKNVSRQKSKAIVVRLFDEDILRISDSLMTQFYFDKAVEGAKILAKAIEADGILFVLNNRDIKLKNLEDDPKHNIYFMGTNIKKYTNGFKHGIITAFNKNLRKSCNFSVSRKDLFIDSYTLIDVYEAVVYNKPVLTRTVNFTGNCIPASCFLTVRIGFTLRELVNQLGGIIKAPSAIIINGKKCGNSVNSLDIPITKYVKSVEFSSKANTTDNQVYSCVKCGACRYNCPVHIAPDILFDYVNRKTDIPEKFLKTTTLCINCGICNTVCQARIPLCQVITMLKNKMDDENEK